MNKFFAKAIRGSSSQKRWKGPIIETQRQILPWMESSFIGHMAPGVDFFQEELIKGGMNMIKIRYMGDNLALLTPDEGERMEDLIKLNK